MADDLRSRAGKVDVAALSEQLGAPVALVAARSGEGIDQVLSFLSTAMPTPKRIELPILQEVPKCRQWAGNVGSKANTTLLRRLSGLVAWTLFSCIPFSDLSCSWPWSSAYFRPFSAPGQWAIF